ncbi:hypothetical protein HZB88_00910 [archaeon]|nr:hypothetical protein [archaeon]
MDIYKILFLLFLSFFIYEYFRHGLTRKIVKYTLALIVIIFLLMILSNYFDIAGIFSRDSPFTTTGAAVIEGARDAMGRIDFADLFNKASSLFSDIAGKVVDTVKSR